MVWIPGGTFLMGSDTHYPEEAPAHQVSVDGFWIDGKTVTNRDLARFVAETGHVTVGKQLAEIADLFAACCPGAVQPALRYEQARGKIVGGIFCRVVADRPGRSK